MRKEGVGVLSSEAISNHPAIGWVTVFVSDLTENKAHKVRMRYRFAVMTVIALALYAGQFSWREARGSDHAGEYEA